MPCLHYGILSNATIIVKADIFYPTVSGGFRFKDFSEGSICVSALYLGLELPGALRCWDTILYYTILYYTILYYTVPYYTIPILYYYYTILYYYYTILYYTILYCGVLYYTVPYVPAISI